MERWRRRIRMLLGEGGKPGLQCAGNLLLRELRVPQASLNGLLSLHRFLMHVGRFGQFGATLCWPSTQSRNVQLWRFCRAHATGRKIPKDERKKDHEEQR